MINMFLYTYHHQARQSVTRPVFKTGKCSDSFTAKRSATSVSITGHRRWPRKRVGLCHSRWRTLQNHRCPMSMSAKYRCKFACSPSPVMVTSLNEWKILEWDEKSKANDEINDVDNDINLYWNTNIYRYMCFNEGPRWTLAINIDIGNCIIIFIKIYSQK